MTKPTHTPPVRRTLIITTLLLLALLFVGNWLSRSLLTFSPDNVVINPNSDYTLDTDTSDLAAIATHITLNAAIHGDALLVGDAITLNDTIGGNLTAIAGNVTLNGHVDGDLLIAAESVVLDGQINGEAVIFTDTLTLPDTLAVSQTLTVCAETLPDSSPIPLQPCSHETATRMIQRASGQIASLWLVSVLNDARLIHLTPPMLPVPAVIFLTALAVLLVAALPERLVTVSATLRAHPAQMLLAGTFVTLLVIGLTVAGVLLIAAVGLLGLLVLPIYLILWAGFVLLLMLGWMALIVFVGGWIDRRLPRTQWPLIIQTTVGGMVASVGLLLLSLFPIGWLAPMAFVLASTAGLGAVYATRLGGRRVALTQ